eukprot:Tbor_TRINITY_DN3814_c0_g1::TRINITY_DN3814_c0_g1_i1::g.5568::m.5568
MSKREQPNRHKWQDRVHTWLIIPHGPPSRAMRPISLEELGKHTSKTDIWMAINGVVYDVTRFSPHHPGGMLILHNYAGKDATTAFIKSHTNLDLDECIGAFRVGILLENDSKNLRNGRTGSDALNGPGDVPPPYTECCKSKGESSTPHRTHGTSLRSDSTKQIGNRSGGDPEFIDALDIVQAAVSSRLFAGVPESQIKDVADSLLLQNKRVNEISKLKDVTADKVDLRMKDTRNGTIHQNSQSVGNADVEEEDDYDSEIGAIFHLLDDRNEGCITFDVVVKFLIDIGGCANVEEGNDLLKKHVSPAVFMKKTMSLSDYISFTKCLD